MRKRKHVLALGFIKIGDHYSRVASVNPPVWNLRTSILANNSSFRAVFPNLEWSVCYDEKHKGPPYREGGPFNKWTFMTTGGVPQSSAEYISRQSGNTIYKYSGGFVSTYYPAIADFATSLPSMVQVTQPGEGQPHFGVYGENAWGDFSLLGPKAWNMFRPGKPAADAAVFFGEIHELPRMLQDAARKWRDSYVSLFGKNPYGKMKDRADTWLGLQFGWLPFLSDLGKFYKAYQKADKIYRWLVENNGRWVKRRGILESESYEYKREVLIDQTITAPTSAQVKIAPVLSELYYPGSAPYGRRLLSRITRQMVWFEALFRYHVPDIESVAWKKDYLRKLFGLQLTPSLVWELTPWSWLVDWFSNVGDVLNAYSETGLVNNLAAKYAYLMGEKSVVLLDEHQLKTSPPIATQFQFKLERKSRVEANPFGFGVTWDVLTPRQWSILTALGLKKSQF